MVVAAAAACGGGAGGDADHPPTSRDATSGPTTDPGDFAGIDAVTEEVSSTTPEGPDADRRAADLIAAVEASIEARGFRTASDLEEAGFVPMPGDPIHWYDATAVEDGRTVDPERPEFVMATADRVLGVMFLASGDETPPDPPGAPAARWHRHVWSAPVCLGHGGLVVVAVPSDGDGCPAGTEARTESPYMFHVWLVGDDPFAAEMGEHQHG